VVASEDARPRSGPELDTLLALAAHGHPLVRSVAVRALGRLEDSALVPHIAARLEDGESSVRAAAARALAQAVHGADGRPALGPLMARARPAADPETRGALAEALGRLALPDEDVGDPVDILLEWSDSAASPRTALGVARGMEALMRGPGPAASDPALIGRLHELARFGAESAAPSADTIAGRVRAVSVLALGQRGRLETATLAAALDDREATVRQTAARFLSAADPSARAELTRRSLQDAEPIVRIEGVRALASADDGGTRCAELLGVARDDPATGVRILALQALGTACSPARSDTVVPYLSGLAGPRGAADASEDPSTWHLAAAALESLARLAPAEVPEPLARLAEHPVSFARAAAARIAGTTGHVPTLEALARDPHPNVRSAALPPLAALVGPDLYSLLVAQLSSDDPQLLITVAGLLERSTADGLAESTLTAFERISAARRETARDPRMALLGVVREHGDAALAARLEPYLADYDALVADAVATMLEAWTGESQTARPEPLPRLALPTAEELRALDAEVVVLTMERTGGRIVIEPLPLTAPTNAHRFALSARSGALDGLTFHRWVPNFVAQGGSPGANEYSGAPAYTRDEVGHPHWRGTVGLSTRGRDTGDGQLFVNLVDNLRLDGDYTIFGRVIEGMDVVDALLEGDVIARAAVLPAG